MPKTTKTTVRIKHTRISLRYHTVMKRYFILLMTLFVPFIFATEIFTNHLEGESSPYLKQHRHNPVDWYPWGEEAFEKAKREHKPIFLSIGYSTCHWCHVMAHESFENPQIAELINRWFVPVKVDREEMPDLDRHFQRIYALIHRRSGGWPLSVFLTEELQPFYVTTYIPPEDSYGVRGMQTLIPLFGKLYKTDREKIRRRAQAIAALAEKSNRIPPKRIDAGTELAEKAVENMWEYYDERFKGFWERPKFPESSRIRLLLDIYRLMGSEKARKMAIETLDAMQSGGLYDQIGGAFFRYCVDRAWIIPHFEKMLYTNAELIPLYVEAWKMTRKKRFKTVVIETVDEINRRFGTKEGLFFSASDADSDHQEGGYYLYRYDDAYNRLRESGFSEKEAKEILDFFDIKKEGNFDSELSHARRTSGREPKGYVKAKMVLKKMRQKRTFPFVDRKIITAWNGMTIKALAIASDLEPLYLAQAQRSYEALEKLMQKEDGSLYHQVLYGQKPEQAGLLEDYAFMADAALTMYQATLQERYLRDAKRWCDIALKQFYEGEGRWLLGDGEIKSYADISDSYYTSPLSRMLNNLLDIALLSAEPAYLSPVKRSLEAQGAFLQSRPDAYPEALRAFLRYSEGVIAIKAKRDTLLRYRVAIENIGYPFLVKEAEEIEGFVACDMRACFAMGKAFETIKEAIEERVRETHR
ncbi:thioredoxin domain-containing protein [Hydrogenimonas urashimensis]|uniref:thioredoxin domain-containing protein n=1 Tax=Hydrogenimonas urashimensis TaxID=2740515 RepID=UPI0019160256|nr:thioredoxin domain-containing protein [Hydrogenimonas urashimensis]